MAHVIDDDKDVVYEADRDNSGDGSHIWKIGGTTVATINNDGTGTGLFSGSQTRLFNVQSPYGAKGDGTTNDTTAIAAAVAACNAAGGGCVYFPRGTYMVDGIDLSGTTGVWLDLASATIKLRANSTKPVIHNSMAANGNYGNSADIRITGGTVDANGFTTGNGIVGFVYADKISLEGVTVLHNAANADWAFQLGGRKGLVTRCRVLGGSITFQDGIHIVHGTDWRIDDNHVESGDDAIALGATFTDPRLQANPESIRRVTVTNNVVNSQKAYGLSIFAQAGTSGSSWEVTDVTVQGLVGQAGVLANGGIRITDLNNSAAGTSQVKRITVRGVNLAVGSATYDDVNPLAVIINSALGVSLSDVVLQITDKTGATTGFIAINIASSQDIAVDRFYCDALGKRYGFSIGSSNRVKVARAHLRHTAASANAGFWLSQVRDFWIRDSDILDMPTPLNGITFSTLNGKASRGRVTGCTFTQTGAAVGFFAPLANFAWLAIEDCDFTAISTATNPASLSGGSSTTINNAGGYLATDTSLIVTDGTQFQALDVIIAGSEAMRCSAVVGNVVTVVRGVLGTTAAPLTNGETLTCRRVLLRANRGALDYTPAYA